MIRTLDLDHLPEVLELLMLQQLAYRLEAERMGFVEIPPLIDSPQTLKESGEVFFGYEEDGRLAGAAACRQCSRELYITRMMVHPDFFRRGIASRLLEHMESFAVPGTLIRVATGSRNEPAVQLYEKHGYEPQQMQLIAPGITLTEFQKIG